MTAASSAVLLQQEVFSILQSLYPQADGALWIKKLLHLLPVLKSTGDAGFAVADFTDIPSSSGSLGDLHKLAATLHGNGIHLVFDWTLNHVADKHPWAQKAVQGPTSVYNNYCIWNDSAPPSPGVPDVLPDIAPLYTPLWYRDNRNLSPWQCSWEEVYNAG